MPFMFVNDKKIIVFRNLLFPLMLRSLHGKIVDGAWF